MQNLQIQELFSKFQDHINNEQELREVQLRAILLKETKMRFVGYVYK